MARWSAVVVMLVLLAPAAAWSLGRGASPRHAGSGRAKPVLRACDWFASPRGSDRNAGRLASPLRTVTALLERLRPGQRGCLLAGIFQEEVTIRRGGQPRAPITLRAAPGDHPTLVGRLVILDSANDVVVQGLNLEGHNAERLPSPTVNGDRIAFLQNNVTNDHTAICFDLGSGQYGYSQDVLIANNRVHDCGQLPPANHEHGIYVSFAQDVVIRGNLIYDNADRGIQLFPNAQNTKIIGNIIDGNGEGLIFSGDETYASSNNLVSNNVISNSRVRYNVESYWMGVVGTGNVVRSNCLWNGAQGDAQPGGVGFVLQNNLVVDPHFVNRAAGNFTLRPGSRCAALLAAGRRYAR